MKPKYRRRSTCILTRSTDNFDNGDIYSKREKTPNILTVTDKKALKENGVLLVCNDEDTAKEYGIRGANGDVSRAEDIEAEGVGHTCGFHLILKRTIQTVIFKDKGGKAIGKIAKLLKIIMIAKITFNTVCCL